MVSHDMSRTNLNNNNNYYSPPPSYEDVCQYSSSTSINRTGEQETIALPGGDTATPTSEDRGNSVRLTDGRTAEFYRIVPTIEITEAGETPENLSANRYDVSIPIYDNEMDQSELPTYERAIREFDRMSPTSRIARSQEIPQTIRIGRRNNEQTSRSAGHTPSRQTLSQWQEYLRRNEQLRLRNGLTVDEEEIKFRGYILGVTLGVFLLICFLIMICR
ncbi:hypothetical protein TSAR_003488 [Trichomalopsis sarcophagae]|uniref:Uncharacterized protein n=1 Tax=Trichomalopsis sarcophagae TaxID=543379 RepID=A0A232EY71_9HYME|nr:hypothetical protein TSAR_003488 [Trichomalopsis sarcophagae]